MLLSTVVGRNLCSTGHCDVVRTKLWTNYVDSENEASPQEAEHFGGSLAWHKYRGESKGVAIGSCQSMIVPPADSLEGDRRAPPQSPCHEMMFYIWAYSLCVFLQAKGEPLTMSTHTLKVDRKLNAIRVQARNQDEWNESLWLSQGN